MTNPDDDWTLSPEQMLWLFQHHNEIEDGFHADDLEALRALADSDAFKRVFGEMGFDEAYDRYQCALDGEDDEFSDAGRAGLRRRRAGWQQRTLKVADLIYAPDFLADTEPPGGDDERPE